MLGTSKSGNAQGNESFHKRREAQWSIRSYFRECQKVKEPEKTVVHGKTQFSHIFEGEDTDPYHTDSFSMHNEVCDDETMASNVCGVVDSMELETKERERFFRDLVDAKDGDEMEYQAFCESTAVVQPFYRAKVGSFLSIRGDEGGAKWWINQSKCKPDA